MHRSIPKLLAGLSICSALVAPAMADQKQPNLFEVLFGNKDGSQSGIFSTHNTTAKQPGQGLPSADPQIQVQGLGLGIVEYVPPLTIPLYDASFAQLKADTPEGEAIRALISDKATPLRAQEAERKAIVAFYRATNFKPLWVEAGGHVSSRADALLKLFESAGEEGLVPNHYLPEVLASFENPEGAIAGDAAKQARLDVGLSLAALHYARHMIGGQFEPNRLSAYNDIKPDSGNADETLKAIAASADPATYLSELAPKMPQYAKLKAALAEAKPDEAFDPIPAGPTIKAGKKDLRLVGVRKRLKQLGFAPTGETTDPTVLDQDLGIALLSFQTAKKLKPTGIVDAATLKALNNDAMSGRREKIIASMERLRWLPRSMGERYVFVNQADFTVHVFDHDEVVWASKVIVGQPDKQTYSFYDNIQTVVFNPKWGVPVSIIINEYAPKMRQDPSYLTRNGFIVVDLKGNEIPPSSVNWNSISLNPNFGVQQLAGGDNALGELKFLFPNAHDIYMHDTPTKNLFKQSVRDFSHGCVRVENPRDFASVLLGWDKDKVVESLDNEDTHSVQLPKKVPVYLTYFTAWTDDKGDVVYHSDIYQRDQAIMKAMAYVPGAKPAAAPPAVAQTKPAAEQKPN